MDNFSSSFEVLRATPNLNSQDKKSASRGQGQTEPVHDAWEVSQSDLMAFPPLFEEESIDSRKARLISYLRGSAELKKKHKEFCITADTKAFGAIWMTFVAHQDPEKQRAPTSERGQGGQVGGTIAALDWCTIPTAILSTRSVGGEADNEGMYERLSKFL